MGGPVSLEKSLQVAREMLAAHDLAEAIHLEEGSGISRGNRFTARGLAKVLDLFAPHADLLRGHDGGANKTGTLDGVRTLAGYATTSSARAGALRDLAAKQQRRDALPAAPGHPVRAVAGARLPGRCFLRADKKFRNEIQYVQRAIGVRRPKAQ